MKKYDLHIHTNYSKCSNIDPYKLLQVARKRGLNGIAITDHNTTKGAFIIKELNKDKNFEVIIGEEIKTDKAEVLAYYLKKEIKPDNVFKVLKEIKRQKALAFIAHPFSFGPRPKLKIDINKIKNKINGLETFNARTFFKFSNTKAQKLTNKHSLAQIAGSDAHFLFEIGRAYTLFRGDLRKALINKTTKTKGTNFLAPFIRSLSIINYLK